MLTVLDNTAMLQATLFFAKNRRRRGREVQTVVLSLKSAICKAGEQQHCSPAKKA